MSEEIQEIEIEKIKIDMEVYPRDEVDNTQVNLYRQNIDDLPPIQLTKKEFILIDGMHRLRAHEIENKKTIKAVLENISIENILLESILRNSRHGKQLEKTEKKKLVRKIYIKNGKQNNFDYCKIFAISKATFYEWTKDLKEKEKSEENYKILQLYLQCMTQEQISERLEVSQQSISNKLDNTKKSIIGKIGIPDSFQISDYWYFSSRDSQYGSQIKGSIAGQVVENFLYYFSNPFDIIVDPMAGGGTTNDVCKAMYRRYRSYDIKPITSRPDIKKHDLRKGFPEEAKGCDVIYLDPPYWHSMKYNNQDSSELSRDDFLEFIEIIAKHSYEGVKKGGIVGFICEDIMKPQKGLYKGSEGEKMLSITDMAPLFEKQGFELIWRIYVPLPLSQYDGHRNNIAKENKVMLHVVRDLLIWRK